MTNKLRWFTLFLSVVNLWLVLYIHFMNRQTQKLLTETQAQQRRILETCRQ
jgi:hypothetical protein